MSLRQTLDYLYNTLPMYQQIGNRAYKKTLDNTLALCEALGNPHEKFRSVHIAGTNGKGSSAHMIAAVLQSAGYRTGLYTSPHLKSFTERIRIDGRQQNGQSVIDFVNNHKALIEKVKPSFFEVTAVMAFDCFVRGGVDVAVIETGLGGRLDSTNVITPVVSLITNIGLDHEQMLGSTIELIAVEKAGIIKKNVPVVIGKTQPETEAIFKNCAKALNAPIVFAEQQYGVGHNFDLQLKGDYQQENIPGVLGVVVRLQQEGYEISAGHIKYGLANTVDLTGIKGRWQVLDNDPLIVCDTAHNADGIRLVIGQVLRMPYKNLHIIWGMVDDKDSERLLNLLPTEAKYYFCQAGVPRAKKAQLLYEEAQQIGLQGEVIEEVNEAIEAAKQQAGVNDLIFIGGSTFVIAEIENLS